MTRDLPSALERLGEIARQLVGREPVVFLDYDGTLTPIVPRPEDAKLSGGMRQAVRALSAHCTVAVVSGRDLEDVRTLVGLEGIYYAGSHGFDIAGPAGMKMTFQQGIDYLPALDRAEKALRAGLTGIDGCQIERKKFAVAIHFRRVARDRVSGIEETVNRVLAENEGLRRTGGKMIFELRPDIDWDKGKALRWLLARFNLDAGAVVPIYLGDDLTDEDALREVRGRGIGILVRDEPRPTEASYALESPGEVAVFLGKLVSLLVEGGGR